MRRAPPRPRAGPRTRDRAPVAPALLLLVLLGLLPGMAGQGTGEGLGLTPPRFDVPAAQAGETYVLTVHVQNGYDSESTMTVDASGEAGAWASTEPGTGFTIAARSQREVVVEVAVPGAAGPGTYAGVVRFTTEPKGSGPTQVRSAVGLTLNVTVGGTAVVELAWTGARVEDAAVGEAVRAFVRVRNDGNVRTTATATGQVLPFASDAPVLAEAEGSAEVRAGDEVEVPVTFAAGLSAGQYRARLRGDGPSDEAFEETLPFKVVQPGEQAPDGVLRALLHPAKATAGRPLRVDARFANVGEAPIRSATFQGEVHDDEGLVATLSTQPLAVAAGAEADLTAYWTPEGPGTYTLRGQVIYDGYQTETVESQVVVAGKTSGWPWWWLLLALVVLALLAILWAWRKGRRDQESPRRGRTR